MSALTTRYCSPEERGYIAGILDGEGCIRIKKQAPRSYGKSACYRVVVHVSNTYLPMLVWLRDMFGGKIYQQREARRRRPCWNWRIEGHSAVRLLGDLAPLLRIKAAQACLALDFSVQCPPYSHLLRRGRDAGSGSAARSSSGTALREGYYLAMKALNSPKSG